MNATLATKRDREIASPPKRPWLTHGAGLLWVLVALCLIAGVLSPHFYALANIQNVLRQMALSGLAAIGMVFVLLTAGIDLSVGSITAVVAIVAAFLLSAGVNHSAVILLALLCGSGLGAINGLGVTWGPIPPFIMTLGTMVAYRGLALTLSKGQPLYVRDMRGFDWLGNGFLLGLPFPVWIFVAVALASWFILRFTILGRNIYAVGSNHEAARLSGIDVPLTTFLVYVFAGTLAGLTAIIFVSRLTVGEPTLGTGLELEAISMAVIGGTSLFGGEGSILGAVVGIAVFAVLADVLNLAGVAPYMQQIIKGAVIISAVLVDVRRRRR